MVYLPAHLTCRPGHSPELLAAARTMIAAARLEPRCILCDLNISIADPQSTTFVKAWKSREALAEHFETPHTAAWRRASEGYFTERRIEIIRPEKVGSL